MKYQIEFGNTLQKLRLEKNLSQAELASLSKLDRTFISLLERGIRQPTLTSFIHLAAALEMKPSELMESFENRLRRARLRRIKI